AIDYQKLRPHHRIMMAMRHRSITKKDPAERTEDDRQFLATYGHSVDLPMKKPSARSWTTSASSTNNPSARTRPSAEATAPEGETASADEAKTVRQKRRSVFR
ncbi:MAG TPA: hypothetical protein VIG67_04310, partial [Yaniella sp.]